MNIEPPKTSACSLCGSLSFLEGTESICLNERCSHHKPRARELQFLAMVGMLTVAVDRLSALVERATVLFEETRTPKAIAPEPRRAFTWCSTCRSHVQKTPQGMCPHCLQRITRFGG